MSSSPSCTVVTAYYKFPSKHASTTYEVLIERFLTTVETPMVIFTEAALASGLMRLRGTRPTRIVVEPFESLRFSAPRFAAHWARDHARDHERAIHNPRLYIIWNEKTAFVERAIRLNAFDTEFYTWCDIGMMREPAGHEVYARWPAPERLAPLARDRIYLLNVEPFQPGEGAILPNGLTAPFDGRIRVGGGCILGARAAWARWIPMFYATIDAYMAADYFTGKDQSVMATLYFKHPDLVELVQPTPYTLGGQPGNVWFYMLYRFV